MREHTGAIQVEVKLSENGEKLCNYSKSCDFTQARDLVIAKVMSELRMSDMLSLMSTQSIGIFMKGCVGKQRHRSVNYFLSFNDRTIPIYRCHFPHLHHEPFLP